MTVEWIVKIESPFGPPTYYSESGWQSDVTHATTFRTKDEAEKIAFSIVTADPSKVGCVSVEEDSA
jgi:hypothetical protein